MTGHPPTSGSTEAVVMVKAAPQVGRRHGETVCCAGIDLYGNWLRLYPVSFRTLEQSKKFGRWDRIKFNWRLPNDDKRIESRRVDQQSIEIAGKLRKSERANFLARAVVTSLIKEREEGRSFALLSSLKYWRSRSRKKMLRKSKPSKLCSIRSALRTTSSHSRRQTTTIHAPTSSNIGIGPMTAFAKGHAKTGRSRLPITTGRGSTVSSERLPTWRECSGRTTPPRGCS